MEGRLYCCYSLLLFACSLVMVEMASGYDTYVMERDCGSGNLTLRLGESGPSSALLLAATDRTSYSLAMDCRIELVASHKIVVSVREIGFRSRLDGNCQDYILIERPMCERLFRLDEERHVFSEGNTLRMLYHVARDIDNRTLSGYPGMKLTATAIHEGSECGATNRGQKKGDDQWFRCDNGHCIWSGLRCDSHNNCGDLSDEQECGGSGSGGGSTVLIILGILILLLLTIMCVATLACSKNESVRRFSNRLRTQTLSYLPRFSR